jgi:hypothetical protein
MNLGLKVVVLILALLFWIGLLLLPLVLEAPF